MENTSIDCTKIRNNSKRTKTSRNEVMQPTTSNNHSQPIAPKPYPPPGRVCQAFYHGVIIRTAIICKKILCYMRDSACRWFII